MSLPFAWAFLASALSLSTLALSMFACFCFVFKFLVGKVISSLPSVRPLAPSPSVSYYGCHVHTT